MDKPNRLRCLIVEVVIKHAFKLFVEWLRELLSNLFNG